eukprot:PITA_10622
MSSLFAFIPILLLLCCQSHALGSCYTISNISEAPDGNSITAQLQLIQNNSMNNSLYGPKIQSLQLLVRYESNDSLRVYITDAKQPRWEVQSDILPRYGGVNSSDDSQNNTHELLFNYSNNPFGFIITRRSSGETLFNSTANATGNPLVFEDQYLEVSTALPLSASFYGLGESTMQTFLLNMNQNYTLWNSNIGSSSTNVDLYGSHPFYLDVRAGGVSHGVLLLNSNGMDVEYGGSFLTYRINGGVLDLYFFSGPSPLAVV